MVAASMDMEAVVGLRSSIISFLALGVVLAPLAGAKAAEVAAAPPPAVERLGVYVLADDMDRAAAFYTALFGKGPQFRTPDIAGYDVGGGLYAVVSKKTYAPGAVRGGNVAPYLKVGDVDAWLARVKAQAAARLVTPAVVREGPFALIKFADPDGNVVEMFQVGPRAAD